MRKLLSLLVFSIVFSFLQGSGSIRIMAAETTNLNREISLVPQPVSLQFQSGKFLLHPQVSIGINDPTSEMQALGKYLSDQLQTILGQPTPVSEDITNTPKTGVIKLRLQPSQAALGEEGYELNITPENVEILAPNPVGLFYGIQTLRQILDVSAQKKSEPNAAEISLPCVKIQDHPRYPWRGFTLDCVRHFWPKALLLRYVDYLAYHKLNVFHLHLTDDQGWRVEIKRYPKLTEIGAFREENGKKYGGFYTQEDLKEIVAYAKSRYITIVPEIEMPGHATAAVAAYPELSCEGKPIPVQTEWGIFETILCGGKEATYEFIQNVLSEVCEIFPSPYIHIGGDEAPRAKWKNCPDCQKRIKDEHLKNEAELQSYLIRRVEPMLAGHNRRLIGWDEILEGGGLPTRAIVHSWRGMEGAIAAAKQGYDVISSPNQFVYFDYPQDAQQAAHKPNWMKVTLMQKVYSFEPVPDTISETEARHVLGAEAPLWVEHVKEEVEVDRMVFPRLCAFSEVVWSPHAAREWNDFQKRMRTHYRRLEKLGIHFYRPTVLGTS